MKQLHLDLTQQGTTRLLDQLAGCLLGQCLGDALGFPVEGRAAPLCAAHIAEVKQGNLWGRDPYAFGQYTDDSQLARELLQSFAAVGHFDPADYAQRIAAIFVEKRIVGRGRATENAARRVAVGEPWDKSGEKAPNAGNGSAMRAGPVGLLCGDNMRLLVNTAIDQGRITHQDPRCNAGSVAIAGATFLAAQRQPISLSAFSQQLAHLTQEVDPGFSTLLQQLPQWCELKPAAAVELIRRAGSEEGFDAKWPGISPFVVPSVLWSLYAFLRTPDDYLASIYTAIKVGGDVDTTAAMTGAISGARAGVRGLPIMAQQVTDRGQWGYYALVSLCGEVVELLCSQSPPSTSI